MQTNSLHVSSTLHVCYRYTKPEVSPCYTSRTDHDHNTILSATQYKYVSICSDAKGANCATHNTPQLKGQTRQHNAHTGADRAPKPMLGARQLVLPHPTQQRVRFDQTHTDPTFSGVQTCPHTSPVLTGASRATSATHYTNHWVQSSRNFNSQPTCIVTCQNHT